MEEKFNFFIKKVSFTQEDNSVLILYSINKEEKEQNQLTVEILFSTLEEFKNTNNHSEIDQKKYISLKEASYLLSLVDNEKEFIEKLDKMISTT